MNISGGGRKYASIANAVKLLEFLTPEAQQHINNTEYPMIPGVKAINCTVWFRF